MGRGLRRSGVLATFLAALALTVAVAEPASAGKAKGRAKHASKPVGIGREQPPGLVGNVHAKAKGRAKKAQEAAVDPPQAEGKKQGHASRGSVQSPKTTKAGTAGGRSNDAHHHVIVCHRTGSASNSYVVLNIPWTAWSEAHDPDSEHAHPLLDGRADLLLENPASRPGGKDGFTATDCAAVGAVAPPPPSTGDPGGALGEEVGGRGQSQLPFTGLRPLIAFLTGLALLAGGLALWRSERGEGPA